MSLEITCPTSLLVGQSGFCFARAHYANGSTSTVAPSWSSSDPTIASFGSSGSLTGRGAGQATVSTEYGGKTAAAPVAVQAEDFLAVTAASLQGTFQMGRTVTMFVIGEYGVASADAGHLNIEITDQDGKLIVAGTPRVVAQGGDPFVLSSTFTIPPGTTSVCRTAVLQIGAIRLTAVGSPGLFPCVSVAP